jgi:biotin carboxylase
VGNKAEARKTMREAGVPVVPGSEDGIRGTPMTRERSRATSATRSWSRRPEAVAVARHPDHPQR